MTTLARPDTPLTPAEQSLSDAAIDSFAHALGGRDALLETLAIGDGSPDIAKVLNFLIDPRYGGRSLRWICHHAGLTIADLFTAYRKALLVKAHLEATRRLVTALPGVVEDLLRRSQPYTMTCETCQGTGSSTPEPTRACPHPSPGPCKPCHGTGEVTHLPDLDRQKVTLELAQLLQKSGGLTIQQNTLNGTFGASAATAAPDAFERLQATVVEGQVRPVPEESS